jgi:photosystem II stability/assembly factor-like uncharacterized protein
MRPTQALRVAFCAVVLCAFALAQEKTMQLFAPSTGWALGNGRLFWTVDNGKEWTDITPNRAGARIADVFFRDEINGSVLLDSDAGNDVIRVDLAATSDGGRTWFYSAIPIPKEISDELIPGGGWVDFADSQHGWVLFQRHTSSAFSIGRLFQTQDGGATWRELPQTPLAARPIFVSPTDGWLAGGPGNMYRTRDGGKTWQGADLEEPSAPSGIVLRAYGALHFTDAKHESVPVTFSPMSGPSTMILFTTSDGGSTWKAAQVLHLPNRYGETPLPSSVVDSTLLFVQDTHITALLSDNAANTTSIRGVSQNTWFTEISFVSLSSGWLRTSDGTLLLTTDGGQFRTTVAHFPMIRK